MLLNLIVLGAIIFALVAAFGGVALAKINARRRRKAASRNIYPSW